jgi:hypothetical protein
VNIVARVHLYRPDHCAGAEMMLHELLKALVQRGHHCEVHLSRFSETCSPYVLDGVAVFPKGTADWQDAADKADVLFTHLDNTSTVISAALFYGKPLVQVLHNTHPATRMWASCRNDLLVYNSDWMRVDLGCDPNGVVVRPPVFVDDYEVDALERGRYITLINTCQAKGGVRFSQLAATMPDRRFLGVLGAYNEQLDPQMPNVEIRAHGQPMRQVYADTKLLLMPSTYESYGRVGVEAACAGIPVIATGTPGIREALGPAGTYLPANAGLGLWQRAIKDILGSPDYYETLSSLARAQAERLQEKTCNELNAFCKRVEALL